MVQITICVALMFCNVFTYAIPSRMYPIEHRLAPGDVDVSVVPNNEQQFVYQLVPTQEYAIAEYYDPTAVSLWDYIPSPITAICKVVRKSLSIVKWVVVKSSLVILGAALVIGFCGFTPYCTLTIRKYPSFYSGYRSLIDDNPIEQIHDFVYNAIEKYKNLQLSSGN